MLLILFAVVMETAQSTACPPEHDHWLSDATEGLNGQSNKNHLAPHILFQLMLFTC